ncbi:MAG: hypothetical protein II453_01595 [Alphaproteobacteria bacterium]|nr:hypothetical protein [Alphaproteobacteria bacterium]
MEKPSMKVPEDFEWNGWSKRNSYLLNPEEFESKVAYNRERYKRALQVSAAWRTTDEGRRQASLVMKKSWEERVADAHKKSDTTEVLLLEKLTMREDGVTTSELVANCINVIAKELAKRGARDVANLELKDLVLISNSLIGLMKTAAATKKEQKPTVQVNNVTVNNTSKTGGVVGGLRDIIDIKEEDAGGTKVIESR